MRTPTERRRLVPAGTLVVLGLVMAGVSLYDVFDDVVGQGAPLVLALLKNAAPLALAGVVAATGAYLYARDFSPDESTTVVRWGLIGIGGMAVIVLWTVGLQVLQGQIKPAFVVAYAAIWGCIAGLTIGVYDVRRHRRERELERVNDLTTELWTVDTELLGADSRDEIETAVCECLTDVDRVAYAWIGAQESADDDSALVCRTATGIAAHEATAARTDGGDAPQTEAIRTGDPQVDRSPDRDDAGTVAVVPLRYEGVPYGVLTVGVEPDRTFDSFEQRALSSLGRRIGDAIHALRSRQALLSDTLVEITFELDGDDQFITAAADETEATIELDAAHKAADAPLAFFEVVDGDPTAVEAVAEDHDAVSAAHVVTDPDEGPARFQVVYDDEPFFEPVTRQGGRVVDAWADDGTGQFRAQLPRDADVRTSERLVTAACPTAELIGRQTVERSVASAATVGEQVVESLTERQLTVAKTAYYGGYFESPRERTGEELAESLDIASPTFHDHLRSAESKLFEAVFD